MMPTIIGTEKREVEIQVTDEQVFAMMVKYLGQRPGDIRDVVVNLFKRKYGIPEAAVLRNGVWWVSVGRSGSTQLNSSELKTATPDLLHTLRMLEVMGV